MDLTIKCRKTGEIYTFWMHHGGGYIYRTSPGRPGTFGSQICAGGRFGGSTVSATPETFARVCRSWYRAHRRLLNS